MPTLYLIDGYAQFFRAYHAIRTPMSSPVTKEPTNMTFGFVGMLLKLLRGEGKVMASSGGKPDYVAVALDVSGDRGTFRSQLDPEYKAHRPPPPEDLFPQVERCLAILKDIGVPVIGAEGFEADDVMATLATRLGIERPDLMIRMISKDKDLKQLLKKAPPRRHEGTEARSGEAGSVELFDIHTDVAFGEDELERDTGLKPSQVVDMLALMGDSVDNVPGVEGVGEKTAAMLVKEYGSLDTLIARAGEIKGKRGEKIREAIPKLGLSKALVTLRRDVPCEFSLEGASVGGFKVARLLPMLKELGFNRYQDEVRALLGESGTFMPELQEEARRHAPPGTEARSQRTADRSSALPRPVEFGSAREVANAVKRPARAESAVGTLFGLGASEAAGGSVRGERERGSASHQCVTTREELAGVVREIERAGLVAVDTETTGTRPMVDRLCGISLSVRKGEGWYVPVRSPTPERHMDEKAVIEGLRGVLESERIKKCGHNLKFDMLILRNAQGEVQPWGGCGVRLGGVVFDSMVASYLIDSSRSSHGLEALSLALLGDGKQSIKELIGSGAHQRTFDTVPLEDATAYAAADADLSLQLMQVMEPQLKVMGLSELFEKVEMPLVEVLAELEWNGVLVDAAELDRQRSRLTLRIDGLIAELNAEAMRSIGRKFDPDSPKQLAAVLFNKPEGEGEEEEAPGLGLKPIKRTKTGYSTDAEVLETLAEDATLKTPIPKLILEYRQLTKLVSTYLLALKQEINPRTGRVHTSFNQTVAATGRLASSDPNLQNIPIRTDIGREIRKAFVAPSGCVLITADYSQIELRLLAHLSRDPALIEAFETGQDIHQQVAAQIHGVPLEKVTKEQRSGAKMVNFGIVYGITAFGLARRLGIENGAAEEIIRGYKKRFAGISTFLEECVAQARRHGYVETIMKRRRMIPEIESKDPSRRAFAERTAINSVVQGSAADLIKVAMVGIWEEGTKGRRHEGTQGGIQEGSRERYSGESVTMWKGGELKMLLQIHDELVFECPEGDAEAARVWVVEKMEGAMRLSVPLRVDAHVAKNWYEGK